MSDQKKEFDFTSDIEIDPNALDVEWLRQPSLVYKIGRMQANAKKEMLSCKDNLALVKGRLSLGIRQCPEGYLPEGMKITEGVIDSFLASSEEVLEAQRQYTKSIYAYEMIQAASNALEHKKEALTNEVKLNGQAYFSSPSVPRDLNKEWENKQKNKQTNEKIKEKMNSPERRSRRS